MAISRRTRDYSPRLHRSTPVCHPGQACPGPSEDVTPVGNRRGPGSRDPVPRLSLTIAALDEVAPPAAVRNGSALQLRPNGAADPRPRIESRAGFAGMTTADRYAVLVEATARRRCALSSSPAGRGAGADVQDPILLHPHTNKTPHPEVSHLRQCGYDVSAGCTASEPSPTRLVRRGPVPVRPYPSAKRSHTRMEVPASRAALDGYRDP